MTPREQELVVPMPGLLRPVNIHGVPKIVQLPDGGYACDACGAALPAVEAAIQKHLQWHLTLKEVLEDLDHRR